MPSDDRLALALSALARPMAEYRTLIHDALVQAEAHLAAQVAGAPALEERARAELGAFADGRIDSAGFARLTPGAVPVPPDALAILREAVATLRAAEARSEHGFVIDLAPGHALGGAVDAALAEAGRAFAAVMIAELIRGTRYDAARGLRALDAVRFDSWTGA